MRRRQNSSKVRAIELRLPVGANQVVSRSIRLTIQNREHFVHAVAAVERRDQRLNDGDQAVGGAGITPLLQVMRSRNVPIAQLQRFRCSDNPLVNLERNLLEDLGKVGIDGRLVHRIPIKDHQQIDLLGIDVANQFLERRIPDSPEFAINGSV